MFVSFLNANQCNESIEEAGEDDHDTQLYPEKQGELKQTNKFFNSFLLNSPTDKKEIESKLFTKENTPKESPKIDFQPANHLYPLSHPLSTILPETDQKTNTEMDSSILHVNQRPHTLCTSSESKEKLNYSDLIQNSTNFLRKIISSLQTDDGPYELSDWEDDEAMKPMELDLDATVINHKKIPSWACGKQLKIAVAKQNQTDGDILFKDLPRRVNIIELFETNVFSYYQKRNKC